MKVYLDNNVLVDIESGKYSGHCIPMCIGQRF